MQMAAQQQLILNAKEEATKQAEEKRQQQEAVDANKVNILDIKVEDDFDIDDIWVHLTLPPYLSILIAFQNII